MIHCVKSFLEVYILHPRCLSSKACLIFSVKLLKVWNVADFNKFYLNELLHKISKEEKIYLLGDFNISFLNYKEHRPKIDFLDLLQVCQWMAHDRTRICPCYHHTCKTLYDNLIARERFSKCTQLSCCK